MGARAATRLEPAVNRRESFHLTAISPGAHVILKTPDGAPPMLWGEPYSLGAV